MLITWPMVGATLGGLVACTALIGFWLSRRAAIMQEGARKRDIELLEKSVESAHEKIRVLQACQDTTNMDTALVKKDIEYIKASVDEIKAILRNLTASAEQ